MKSHVKSEAGVGEEEAGDFLLWYFPFACLQQRANIPCQKASVLRRVPMLPPPHCCCLWPWWAASVAGGKLLVTFERSTMSIHRCGTKSVCLFVRPSPSVGSRLLTLLHIDASNWRLAMRYFSDRGRLCPWKAHLAFSFRAWSGFIRETNYLIRGIK